MDVAFFEDKLFFPRSHTPHRETTLINDYDGFSVMEISIADCRTSPSGGLPTQTGDSPNQTDDNSSFAAITTPRDIAQNGLNSDIPNGPCNPCDCLDCDNAKNGPYRNSPSGP